MLKQINESLERRYTIRKRSRLSEGKIRVDIDLGNRHEYVSFDSEWAAKLKAQDYIKAKNVKSVEVMNTETGEVIFSQERNDHPIKESKSKMSSMLKKFNTAYNWMYENDFDTYDLMIYGEKLMKENPELLQEFVKYRGDLLTSDREIAAFVCALGYAGRVIDVDEYLSKIKKRYYEKARQGLLSYPEADEVLNKKVKEIMKALNME